MSTHPDDTLNFAADGTVNCTAGTAPLSRRSFLSRSASGALSAGATWAVRGAAFGAIGAPLLAACGSQEPLEPANIAAMFSPDRVLVAGIEQRIPFAIIAPNPETRDQTAIPDEGESVTVALMSGTDQLDSVDLVGSLVAHDHVEGTADDHQHADLLRYYPARFTMPEPGIYDLVVTIRGVESTLPVQAFDANDVFIPIAGSTLAGFDTPTFDNPEGVDQLCTRVEGPCPFHETSYADVLAAGRPSAILVATPAYCSTAYCGPVVDTLMDAAQQVPGIDIIHTEVYANALEFGGNFTDPGIQVSPAVQAMGLHFEPSLFLLDGTGTVLDRIDNVFDVDEAVAALTLLDSL